MIFLPPNLAALGDARLAHLDRAVERDLKKEMDRIAKTDVRFARALRQAMAVDDEIERRRGRAG